MILQATTPIAQLPKMSAPKQAETTAQAGAANPRVPPPPPRDPIDQLPDLSAIESRATQETAATTPAEPPISDKKIGALAKWGLAGATALSLLAAAPAQAHGYGYGYGYGYGGHHHHGGGGWGAFLGGLAAGAIIGNMSQQYNYNYNYNYNYQPPVVVPQPYRDGYGNLVCPSYNGGYYVSPNPYYCQ